MDVINNAPMTTPTASSFIMLPAAKMMARPKTTTETQTPSQHEEGLPTMTGQQSTHTHKTSTSHYGCTNGKSTIANANIKARCGRRHGRRQCVQATKDGNKRDSTSKIPFSNLTKAQQSKVIKSRWVLQQKGKQCQSKNGGKGIHRRSQ